MYLKTKIVLTLCAVVATVYMASCESDPFMEDFSSLDINSCVPLTRSSPQEINNSFSYRNIPKDTSECMLNAITRIALFNGKPVFNKYIHPGYTASDAYYALRDSAIHYSQDKTKYEISYNGGAMMPSLGAEVGKKSGILNGTILRFSNYDELYRYLSNPEWKYDRKSIISCTYNGNSHASVCQGVKDDYIKIYSAQNGNDRMKRTETYTNISIIY